MLYSPEELLALARAMRERAYAPYSGFRVGAALACADGTVYGGCNVENASFGLSICAERVAVFRAVADGRRSFVALALVGSGPDPVYPCGACRQVLHEFAPDLTVVVAGDRGEYRECKLEDLLPRAYDLKVLREG
ncbi:MAG: cytidine deaminase [Desulfotomaculales bacterium]